MKRTVLSLSLIIGLSSLGFAQQEELKSASANIEKKDYISALDDLNKAKKKVSELMIAQLASVLPAKIGELEMVNEDMGYGMDSQGVDVNKVYRKKVAAVDDSADSDPMEMDAQMEIQPEIRVRITTNMMAASEVMNAHSMADQGMDNSGSEPIRIKGYRALVRSNSNAATDGMEQQQSEEAQAIVGGAFIQVFAQGLDSGQAKTFLELIDFEKLIGLVGK